ncbi:uncharacterized protein PITG_04152 [Phytophthora infestans T30-4]|uniref:Uncharacterized protein n=1 Tax=Phytophthora infestans (strain T30-4) TaxID=403677 RepID=D0N0P2_PHYIT|nr:uncharacterized protein PITG_04152 [Phytophthora infestans T30-4]EEY67205.1 conserved hypothetical protein [Phytophthora infestans T30-4]|eukprot:XP_002905853.1 conserved hypothetical protein [Phytophthora infestans T30-4]
MEKSELDLQIDSSRAESSQESELGSLTSRNKTAPASDIDIATSFTSANPGVTPGLKNCYPTKAAVTKLAGPSKLAVITLPDKHVPSGSRVIVWATNTSDRYHVSEILAGYPTSLDDDFMNARVAHSCRESVSPKDYIYNSVILKLLVIKLKAVIEAERKKRPKSKYFNPVAPRQQHRSHCCIFAWWNATIYKELANEVVVQL